MSSERGASGASLLDILDRVLDKGVVVDPWARVAAAAIDLRRGSDRLVVASVETLLDHQTSATPGAAASRAGRGPSSR
jgi:hypothetical protein